MRKLKNIFLSFLKQIKRLFKRRSIAEKFLHKDIPYFSQWESPQLAESILKKEIDAGQDPNWKKSGAATKEEYAVWSWNGCGMACTKMLAAHLKREVIPLVTLGKKCADYGGYTLPVENSAGLIYKPYTVFMEKELRLRSKVINPLLVSEIIEELSEGNYVIASVSPQIREVKSRPRHKGGHLVLVLGYDLNKQQLFFHNPSGFTSETQEYAAVTISNFKKFFGKRGIVVYK